MINSDQGGNVGRQAGAIAGGGGQAAVAEHRISAWLQCFWGSEKPRGVPGLVLAYLG